MFLYPIYILNFSPILIKIDPHVEESFLVIEPCIKTENLTLLLRDTWRHREVHTPGYKIA